MIQLCVVASAEQGEKDLKQIDILVTGEFLSQHINYGSSWSFCRQCPVLVDLTSKMMDSQPSTKGFPQSEIYALPESVQISKGTSQHPIHVCAHHLAAALPVMAFTLQGKA